MAARRLLPQGVTDQEEIERLLEGQRTPKAAEDSEAPQPRICRVSICRIKHCRLRSHANYRLHRHKPSIAKPALAAAEPYDGLPALPLEEADLRFRDLFHEYFGKLIDSTLLRILPPKRASRVKDGYLRSALNNTVTCMAVLAAASYKQISLRTDDIFSVPRTVLLYGKLVTACRKAVQNLDSVDINGLVVGMQVLCLYDHYAQHARRIETHRRAMDALILKQGGMQNLGFCTIFIRIFDQSTSLMTCHRPNHHGPVLPAMPLPVNAYASAFGESRMRDILSPDVILCCQHSAHLLEIAESNNIDFQSGNFEDSPALDNFYYLRDALDSRWMVLNSMLAGQRSLEESVFCASYLVYYVSSWGNPIPAVSKVIAKRILDAIGADMLGERAKLVWNGYFDVLLWVLITCSVPFKDSERPMVIQRNIVVVSEWLFDKSVWQRKDWWTEQTWSIASKFVWSKYFRGPFDQTCTLLLKRLSFEDELQWDVDVSEP